MRRFSRRRSWTRIIRSRTLRARCCILPRCFSHKKTERLGLLPVPASLPRGCVPAGEHRRAIFSLEDILLAYADHVFEMYDVLEKTVLCVTRNADIQVGRRDLRRRRRRFSQKDGKAAAAAPPYGCRARGTQPSHQRPLQGALPQPLRGQRRTDFPVARRRRSSLGMRSRSASTCRKNNALHLSATRPSRRSSRPCCLPGQSLLKAALQAGLFCCPIRMRAMEPFLQMIREAANDPDVSGHPHHDLPAGTQGQAGRIPVRCRRKRQGRDRTHRAARPL